MPTSRQLDGAVRWRHHAAPTMAALPTDGTTIIATPPVAALAVEDGTSIWESDVANANPSVNPVSVSEDGSRVAVSTFEFEAVVLEEGEPRWADTNEAGPHYTGLAADGTTLATLALDNDAQTAEVAGYRL